MLSFTVAPFGECSRVGPDQVKFKTDLKIQSPGSCDPGFRIAGYRHVEFFSAPRRMGSIEILVWRKGKREK
jgi:hypothetical protein